jgi:hypothetical protein
VSNDKISRLLLSADDILNGYDFKKKIFFQLDYFKEIIPETI